jgi:outer membrane protein
MKKLLILFLLLFSINAMQAQKIFNLKECMNFAVNNSPKYKIQEAKNKNTSLDFREAYLNFIPSFSGSVSGMANFGRSIDPETNTYTTTTSFNNAYGIYASYTVFNGFTAVNNFKIANVSRSLGVEEAKLLKDDICLKTIQSYFNVLYYNGMQHLAQEQLEESSRNLKFVTMRKELGLCGDSEILQAEARFANSELNLTQQENNLEQAILTLKGVMFFPLNETIRVDTVLAHAGNITTFGISSETLVTSAKAFLPTIKISEQNMKIAKYKLNNAKWKLLPNINFESGFSTNYYNLVGTASVMSFREQLKNNQGKYLYVSMNVPVFSALERLGNISRNKNNLAIAKYEHLEKINEIETEVAKAVQELNAAEKEYWLSCKNAQTQELAHKTNQKKYEAGWLSILELHSS